MFRTNSHYLYHSDNKNSRFIGKIFPAMKKFVLIIVVFMIIIQTSAQDYQNICTAGKTLFARGQEIKGYRTDSILLLGNNDTLFISFPAARDTTAPCQDTTGGSVLGRRIVRNHTGCFWFFNFRHDTIFVDTRAGVNDTWKFFSLPQRACIEAKVTGMAVDSFAGITDSVRIITLQARDSSGQNITHIFNSKVIRLSKHFGLVRLFDLYIFPRDTAAYYLAGKSIPPIGLQDITVQEIYDFNIGDEFHFTGMQRYNDNHSNHYNWNEIWSVVNKSYYGTPDSVSYLVKKCRLTKKTTYNTYTDTTYIAMDTLVNMTCNFLSLSAEPYFTGFPDEYDVRYVDGWCKKYYWQKSPFDLRLTKGLYRSPNYSQCYMLGGAIYSVNEYTSGLGMTGEAWNSNMYGGYIYSQELVYYKKGQETWGTPVATDCRHLLSCLHVNKDTIQLAYNAMSESYLYINACYDWDITGDIPAWLSIEPTSGRCTGWVVFTTTEAIPDTASRSAVIAVHSLSADTVYITVIQAGFPFFYSHPDTFIFPSAPAITDTLHIITNQDWELKGSIPDWLSIAPLSGSRNARVICRTVSVNPDTIARGARLWLYGAPDTAIMIDFIQQPTSVVSAQPDTIILSSAALSQDTLLINTNYYDLEWWVLGEIPPWLSVVPVTGKGNGRVVFRAELPNPDTVVRSSAFMLSSGQLSKDIPITVIQKQTPAGIPEPGHSVFEIYPNPTHGPVRFRSGVQVEMVKVYSPLGLLLQCIPVHDNTGNLNLSGTASGIYILRFVAGRQEANLKIVVL